MSSKEQFDRSKCFTFFNTYRTQGKRIREKYGDKMAADYYEAIIDYGLDQKPITDDELMLLIGETLLETIDSSQKRRSRGFGENTERTKAIFIEMVKEFTGGTFNCNKDEVKKVCAYICGVPETTFVPRVDPKPDDLSSDTDTVDSGSDSPDLADSGLTDPSTDMVSTDITDSDSVTDSASDSSADLAPSDITVPSDTKDSSTVVPINQDNTDISGSNPGDAA